MAICVYWQGDPPRHVPAGGEYGWSAIVALRVVGDRLWRRSGGPSQSHSLKHQQHCHCAEGASQERSSHDTRLRTSSANIAFGQDSNNVSALLQALPSSLNPAASPQRLEEPTSELQSLMRISYAVFCLKKKN